MQNRTKRLLEEPLYPTSATPYAAYSPGKLDVLLHNGNSLGMDGA